jgi:MinD-like ATPase involved in chromosome partitioning or flagellar assembly
MAQQDANHQNTARRPDYTGVAGTGFESEVQRRQRMLRSRPAESWPRRIARTVWSMVGSDDYPEQLSEAAAGVQAAVTTGRRILVTGSRGGGGKSTTAGLLARIFATVRQEPAAGLDLDPGLGTLALHAGAADAPSLEDFASQLRGADSLDQAALAAMLGDAGGGLYVSGSRGNRPTVNGSTLNDVLTSVSRYFPVTTFDGSTGIRSEESSWALSRAHAVVFAAPATVAGMEDLRWYAGMWRSNPELADIPLLAVLTAVDGRAPFDPDIEAETFRRHGLETMHLPYDRHLSAGSQVDLSLLAPGTRLQATRVAARALQLANGTAG